MKALWFAALAIGCTCPAVAVPAVVVKVVDRENVPVRDASVSYTIDDGKVQPADCVPPPPEGAPSCDSWQVGVGRAGAFHVMATGADGTQSASQSVEVAMDGCSPDQKSITLRLR
jgi:hypothetical protein